MLFLFVVALIALSGYLVYRGRRGFDQPTIWEDIKALFGFGKRSKEPHQEQKESQPHQEAISSRDGYAIEEDPELSDIDRLDEIMGLNDLWNQSPEAESNRADEK